MGQKWYSCLHDELTGRFTWNFNDHVLSSMKHDAENKCVIRKATVDPTAISIAEVAMRVSGTGKIATSSLEAIRPSDVPFEHQMATKQELAVFFGVEVRTIENWQRDRRIPYIKIGGTVRFKMGEVIRHIERNFVFPAQNT